MSKGLKRRYNANLILGFALFLHLVNNNKCIYKDKVGKSADISIKGLTEYDRYAKITVGGKG